MGLRHVNRLASYFLFFSKFDILVDGYNSLVRNSVRYYLLFRARDSQIVVEMSEEGDSG